MQYRLLRNNIASGPFSKEELFVHGLKTTDQLKIDGDISWRPASSFEEFKHALEVVAKPKYKFTADKKLVEVKHEKEPAAGKPVSTDPQADTPPAGASPFKRAPSALPKKKTGAVSATTGTTQTSTNTERASHKGEMRDEGKQPFIKKNTIHNIEHAPKMEHRRKPIPKPVKAKHREANSNFIKEFFLPILIIGGIGFLIWWGYQRFTATGSGNNASVVTAAAITDSNDMAANPTEDSQAATLQPNTDKNATAKTAIPPAAKPGAGGSTVSLSEAQRAKKIQDSIAAAKIARQRTAEKAAQHEKAAAAEKAAKEAAAAALAAKAADTPKTAAVPTPAAKQDKTPPVKKETAPKKTAEAKTPPKAKDIGDYLNMSLNKSPDGNIKNIKIKVHNVSKEDLNIAVIEVRYYDKEGKFIKGETLQTGKIGAGKTETVKVPNSKDANRISYKASLISGDKVYLMGN